MLGSPDARVAGNWGATDELLSTLGVKETFQNWIWDVLPQHPKYIWAGRNPEGREGPRTHSGPLLLSGLELAGSWRAAEWIGVDPEAC